MIKIDTERCIMAIVHHFYMQENATRTMCNAKNWKRLSKKGTDIIIREFQNKISLQKVIITSTLTDILSIVENDEKIKNVQKVNNVEIDDNSEIEELSNDVKTQEEIELTEMLNSFLQYKKELETNSTTRNKYLLKETKKVIKELETIIVLLTDKKTDKNVKIEKFKEHWYFKIETHNECFNDDDDENLGEYCVSVSDDNDCTYDGYDENLYNLMGDIFGCESMEGVWRFNKSEMSVKSVKALLLSMGMENSDF